MPFDIAAIRSDLTAPAQAAGFDAWPFQPDDLGNLPACVIGGVISLVRLNRLRVTGQIKVTFYVSLGDAEDATRRLDTVMSMGTGSGYVDKLAAATLAAFDQSSWRYISGGPYQPYVMPDGSTALGCDLILEITA